MKAAAPDEGGRCTSQAKAGLFALTLLFALAFVLLLLLLTALVIARAALLLAALAAALVLLALAAAEAALLAALAHAASALLIVPVVVVSHLTLPLILGLHPSRDGMADERPVPDARSAKHLNINVDQYIGGSN